VALPMRDVLVVLPGISGSVLEKNGMGEIWAPLPRAVLTYIKTLGKSLDALQLQEDNPELPEAPDGVRATRLVPYTLIPGLHRFDGYAGLRKKLHREFDLVDGDALGGGPPANYFEFPYDWRRDNRASARSLKSLIERELPRWQEQYPQARVILLAHSMGGIVARWYLEKLDGHDQVKALITFATPHRGAPNAADYIANGHRKLWLDFTAALRGFESVYQLLPIYESVLGPDGAWHRVAEIDIPSRDPSRGSFDRPRAEAALSFHRDIEAANSSHRLDDKGVATVLPIQGWGQSTLQSARIDGKRLIMSDDLPPAVEESYRDGDGTVPSVSAIPLEFHDKPARWWPFNQRHSTIQDAAILLGNLVQTLRHYQGLGKPPARGPAQRLVGGGTSFEVDDVYLVDEPVTVTARFPEGSDPGSVTASIRPRVDDENGTTAPAREIPLLSDVDAWTGSADPLEPGSYRIALQVQNPIPGADDPLVDVFEVG
jgi:pimeloyl-ACP methyl ester carboxylesterase